MDILNKSEITIVSEIDPKVLDRITEAKKNAWLDHETNEETIINVVSSRIINGHNLSWAEEIVDANSERPEFDRTDYLSRLTKVSELITNGFNLKFTCLIGNMKLSKVSINGTKLRIEIVTGDIPEEKENV